jgi:hypothetical protein
MVEPACRAEGIAFDFTNADGAGARLQQFEQDELRAIAAFLNECARRCDDARFRDAERAVRARIQEP